MCMTRRVGSPKISKRKSCPNINSPYHAQSPKGLVSCSITSDRIPDFTLPERVQPSTPRDAHGRVFSFSASQRHSSVGAIKPELYTAPGSSEEESDALPKSAHGRLWFSLLYDAVVGQLSVTLVKVKDLPGRASSSQQARDPFVKMFLLPDEKSTRMSKVKKKTLSPIYNETHTFEVAQEDIAGRVLRFSVYDVDKRRVRHSLGHVMIPLRGVDLTRGDVTMSELEPMVQAAASLGDLQVSLAYYPQNDKIKVGFHRARNLQGMDEEAEATTYIRAQLYYGHKNVRTKRTTTRPTSSDHHINESVSFTVAGKQLSQCSIVVALVTTSPYSKGQCDEDYGRTVIGPFMYARGEELVHWQDMVAHPRVVATRWHSLTGKHEGPAKGALHFSH